MFDPCTQKIQYTFYGINGEIYKKGFVSSYRRLSQARNRANLKYGGGLTVRTEIVSKERKSFVSVAASIEKPYCFCSSTPIFVNRCETCGNPPFTD